MLDAKTSTDEAAPFARLDASTYINGGPWCSMAVCRFKRKLLVFTIMCCATVWIVMFLIGISCCAVVHRTNSESHHVLVVKDWETPEANLRQYRSELENAMSKKLLEDTSSWQKQQENQKKLQGKDFSSRLLFPVHEELKTDVSDDHEIDENSELFQNDENHERTSGTNSASPSVVISKNSADGTRKLPQAIIIGVKKGGTRALLEFLRIHPDVRAPGPETHFFDRYYHKGIEWYRRQMPATIPGQLTVEKTPSYLITKEVPRRIYSMSKDTKLVVVVRDPVTRAISDYTQAASKRPGMKPFEQMAFLSNYTGLVNTSWGAIRIGVYAKHVDRWLKYFPLSQIHFVSGEKLITDPAGEMTKVQDFLGLKRVINEKHFYFNETKGFPCLKKKEGSARPHCLGKSKGRQHPSVSSQVLSRLQDFFRPFNAKLYQMVGQDFGWP